MISKQIFDLALALDWEYDWDFIRILEKHAQHYGLSTYIIWPGNLDETIVKTKNQEIFFRYLFDRASDSTPEFFKLQKILVDKGVHLFETLENLKWASDKATMHLEFIHNGINTPYTIILPSYEAQQDYLISVEDLAILGRNFIIKPANTTGGGIGVVHGAETLQEVLSARQFLNQDKYLIQEIIHPLEKDGQRFWFRGFYSCGLVQCAWWNDRTHLYRELNRQEIRKYKLKPVFEVISRIAEVSRLKFFSTEIALTEERSWVVIDYVNESCDMRIQSKHFDGVPDIIIDKIGGQITKFIKEKLK